MATSRFSLGSRAIHAIRKDAPVVGGCREKTKHDNPFNVSGVEPTKEQTMKCDKYMGMDVHQAMTVVAVMDGDGKVILETMVSTEASAIIRLLKSISGPLHVTFEETTQ